MRRLRPSRTWSLLLATILGLATPAPLAPTASTTSTTSAAELKRSPVLPIAATGGVLVLVLSFVARRRYND